MFQIAGMDPNVLMSEEQLLDTKVHTITPITTEEEDKNNECMDWNINDVISQDEYENINIDNDNNQNNEEDDEELLEYNVTQKVNNEEGEVKDKIQV